MSISIFMLNGVAGSFIRPMFRNYAKKPFRPCIVPCHLVVDRIKRMTVHKNGETLPSLVIGDRIDQYDMQIADGNVPQLVVLMQAEGLKTWSTGAEYDNHKKNTRQPHHTCSVIIQHHG